MPIIKVEIMKIIDARETQKQTNRQTKQSKNRKEQREWKL